MQQSQKCLHIWESRMQSIQIHKSHNHFTVGYSPHHSPFCSVPQKFCTHAVTNKKRAIKKTRENKEKNPSQAKQARMKKQRKKKENTSI
jgi:hypothetical protein